MSRSETHWRDVQHGQYTIEIHFDHDCESPRSDTQLGIMLADGHRQYSLGDHHLEKSTWSYDATRKQEYLAAQAALHHYAEERKLHLFPRWCKINLGSMVVLPLGLIDHSGISMYVGGGAHPQDPGGWDSGLVGFIFDTTSQRQEWDPEGTWATPEKVEAALRAEVKYYDAYLTGQVYGWVLLDEDGMEVESRWGYIGDEEDAIADARDEAGWTCLHCERDLVRNVGPVMDTLPEGEDSPWLHNACAECGVDVAWGHGLDGKAGHWYHLMPDHMDVLSIIDPHPVTITHRYHCQSGVYLGRPLEMQEAHV